MNHSDPVTSYRIYGGEEEAVIRQVDAYRIRKKCPPTVVDIFHIMKGMGYVCPSPTFLALPPDPPPVPQRQRRRFFQIYRRRTA